MEDYIEDEKLEDDEKYEEKIKNYKEEAEKIKKARGFLVEDFYTSYVNEWEVRFAFLDLDKFQRVINKSLDKVEENKIKYNITDVKTLALDYISALKFRAEKFEMDPEPYFATNEDYESWLYD